MSNPNQADNPELDELFERFRAHPDSHVFAPLADACRKAGLLDEALEVCTRGLQANPRYASGYVVQGKCHFDAGQRSQAEASFRRVLDLDPNNLVALKYLGIIRAGRGDAVGARVCFERILALDPEDRVIRDQLAELEQGRKPEVYIVDEAGNDVLDSAGDILEEADHEVVELDDLEDEGFEGEPITLRDESVTPDEIATITLADIYAEQGYKSKALKIYREALRRQPQNRAVLERIEALERGRSAKSDAVGEGSFPVDAASPAPRPEAPAETPTAPPPAAEPQAADTASPPVEEGKSYEQFKRWLRSVSG